MATSQPGIGVLIAVRLALVGAAFVAGGLVVTSLGGVDFFVREPVRLEDEGALPAALGSG